MARRLAKIAEEINEKYPVFIATIDEGHCNTDRKLAGTRLIHKGKGRTGTRLTVRWRHLSNLDPRAKVFEHNSAETYRRSRRTSPKRRFFAYIRLG